MYKKLLNRAPTGRRREAGWGLVSVFVVIAFTSVAISSQLLVASYASLGSRRAQHAYECRQAALDVVRAAAPVSDGGSIAPAAPLDGWTDLVFHDSATGAIVDAETTPPPDGVGLIRRQWRTGPNSAGSRVLEVSAVSVRENLTPQTGPLAASVVLSRRVE